MDKSQKKALKNQFKKEQEEKDSQRIKAAPLILKLYTTGGFVFSGKTLRLDPNGYASFPNSSLPLMIVFLWLLCC
ncbi:MAG: hypothetical protein NW226_06160 [Microscillaceae bacterium]|nr:hypothetical protein [Microscillaceae bacterium]